jgi:SHS2 domain-containing protein
MTKEFKKTYSIFDQTSDLGIEVKGKNLKELFVNSAIALFDLMADLESVNPNIKKTIETESDDIDLLLRNWLGELLYASVVDEILFKSFDIKELNRNKIKAIAFGEKINPIKHIIKREIKSVTYHQLKVECKDNQYIARFVLDV